MAEEKQDGQETANPKPKRQARKPRAQKNAPAKPPAVETIDAAGQPNQKPQEPENPAPKRKAPAKKPASNKPRASSRSRRKAAAKEAEPKPPEAPLAAEAAEAAREKPEELAGIIADAKEIFRFDPVKGHQDRAHEYLVRCRIDRGSDDTATEVAVVDLVERAFKAGIKSAGAPIPGLDRLAARLAKAGGELIEQSAELIAMNGGR